MFKIIQICSSENASLNEQLAHLVKKTDEKYHVKIIKKLTETEIEQLSLFITNQKPLPVARLTLNLDLKTLKNPKFLDMLQAFNATTISRVELIFTLEEVMQYHVEITQELNLNVAPKVFYPLKISELQNLQNVPSTLDLHYFEKLVINNIQQRHNQASALVSLEQVQKSYKIITDHRDSEDDKIKLKELIRNKNLRNEDFLQYLPLEVQYTEVVEQEIAHQEQEVLDVTQQLELHELQEYDGQLLGFQEFSMPHYKNITLESIQDEVLTERLYALLEQELFANLPHAIKFISPDAAEQLAVNLTGFVTLNKDNLPNGFILKQTKYGEYVLDFDPYLENEQSNPFTPEQFDMDPQPLYTIELKAHDLKSWIDDEQLFQILCSSKPYTTPKYVTNLWIKYGDQGVILFFVKLKEALKSNSELAAFILSDYLVHLPQWDHLYSDELFFASLKRVSHYSEQKLSCLKKLLHHTGSSRHNLSKTIEAFECFWNELNFLCTEQKISTAEINQGNWSTPQGGNPVVYMERMLVILKNARSLAEQFQLLEGINLDNYGAYYASCYESFKIVSVEMALKYDAVQLNKSSFSKDFTYYRVELDNLAKAYILFREYQDFSSWNPYAAQEQNNQFWLINREHDLPENLIIEQGLKEGLIIPFEPNKFVPPYMLYRSDVDGGMKLIYTEKPQSLKLSEYIAQSYRVIGLQQTGITIISLRDQFTQFKNRFRYNKLLLSELITTLFFVIHERYIETQPLAPLLELLNDSTDHSEVINTSIKLLSSLYNLDIKLNQAEGIILFQSIAGMNSCEFELLGISKIECISKLLKQLEHNKFATFKFFNFRIKSSNPKWPFLYALDTAEYLAREPIIAATYHDDLLLFSGLINSISDEAYCHAYLNPSKKEKSSSQKQSNDTKENTRQERIRNNLEKVRYYLQQAASKEQPNNLHYAIQILINAKQYFTYANFLKVSAEIETLGAFNSQKVEEILRKHQFMVSANLPELFTRDNADLKAIIIELIIHIELLQNIKSITNELEPDPLPDNLMRHQSLASMSLADLQMHLEQLWKKSGILLSVTGKIFLSKILKLTKEMAIKSAFALPEAQGLLKVFGEKIGNLIDFQGANDFDKVNGIANGAEKIASLLREILKNSFVKEHEPEFIALFEEINFSRFDYEVLYRVLTLLTYMPQRNYLPLLNTIFTHEQFIGHKERVVALLNLLSTLNNCYFPSEYLHAFSKIVVSNPGKKEFAFLINQMVKVYEQDNKDFILELVLSYSLTYDEITLILKISEGIVHSREDVARFFIYLLQTQSLQSFLTTIAPSEVKVQQLILEILGKGHALNRRDIGYQELAQFLITLSKHELEVLVHFYEATPVSAESLLATLARLNFQKPDDLHLFLLDFEKAPFAARDDHHQFSITEVERVINHANDVINQTKYTYQYRKQLMESFLFVNAIGSTLPVYHNKSAKNLTNSEIKTYFTALKAKQIPELTKFQRQLMALGLMREALYRSTGEFPYSTQIISLLDGMMHPGDYISNIDTGQGKSLIDVMKAVLLWLDSDRVDLTTSSLVDAKRDIANYGAFLKLLEIPYSKTPISSLSSITEFQQQGINFSTFAQLSLFFAKAKVTGTKLDTVDTVISLVANESDYTFLDDRVIYRFATADRSGISYGQEWIYYAINDFVTRKEFIENERATTLDDITDLKNYLEAKAKTLKKSLKIIHKFDDSQYLVWLESALAVNFLLNEEEQFVIPDEFEKRIVHGTELRSKVAKVLMKDGKVSADSTFGNGIQQLLHARLNKERGSYDFIIAPQTKIIISTNNKNLIDYYRSRSGFIWGSSGTVGSDLEIHEQYTKYGFDFTKIAPHQINQVKFNKPIIMADERAQFDKLINLLMANKPGSDTPPSLVFCKNIKTATRLFNQLKKQNPKQFPLQLYTGLGKEEDYIAQAGNPGMITITTSALGRNTNIKYNRINGLIVWHTFIDSTRNMGQKSGRTGRQGSAGKVNFILNSQELSKKEYLHIQNELDHHKATERAINEELYDLLGYFLMTVDLFSEAQFIKGKSVFLRESWSQFSTNLETQFRKSRLKVDYNKETFIEKTLSSFNVLLATALKNPCEKISLADLKKTIAHTHQEKTPYRPHSREVKIKDCSPPVALAYHLLNFTQDEKHPEETKALIYEKLHHLFSRLETSCSGIENQDYLAYLTAYPTTQEVVVAAHKEFVTQYLQNNSQKLNTFQRWCGYQGRLNKLLDNHNYLLMFHAFAHTTHKPLVELATIQKAVIDLLEEYLETSWFINTERRTWARELKDKINRVNDLEELISLLSRTQIQVIQEDVETNKHRRLKPLHFFGHSRYVTTLNKAFNLASSLAGKTQVDEMVNELVPLLAETTDKCGVTQLTLDELSHRAVSNQSDKGNASVIINTLENALTIQTRTGPKGMVGRAQLFNPVPNENLALYQVEALNPIGEEPTTLLL